MKKESLHPRERTLFSSMRGADVQFECKKLTLAT
jgi:hypothetical protein